jgi:putative ABC transport system substrate-binding protein
LGLNGNYPVLTHRCVNFTIRLALTAMMLMATAGAVRAAPARIGFLWVQDEAATAPYHQGWVEGLRELGYIDGKNVVLITRYANGDESRFPSLLGELLQVPVDVLVVSSRAIRPALKATATIPIVCATMNDPVSEGLVTNLARPGRNLTGVSWQAPDTATKRLELALELRPKLTHLALIYDGNDKVAQRERDIVMTAAQKTNLRLVTYDVRNLANATAAFAAMSKDRPQTVHLVQTAVITALRTQIAVLAIEARVPLISAERSMAQAGGVLTYGPKLTPVLKSGAAYVDKILRGAAPQDLPIEQAREFELVVNLKSAKAIGVNVPQSILARADYVIR